MTQVHFEDRGLGLLWGAHCGDSLGATLEFGPPSADSMHHNKILGKGPFNWEPGAATDDTDLLLFVLESLVSRDLFDFDKLKNHLVVWADSSPKDIGNTTKKGIENLRLGLPLRECGYKHPTMYGNGSIMRAAPLAFYRGADWREVATTQCLMTHGHDLCVEVDLLYIGLLKDLLETRDPEKVLAHFFSSLNPQSELTHILTKNAESSWEELSTSGHAAWTLGAGLWALKNTFKGLPAHEALIQVVNRGDDSDTCGAVAGALLGSYFGATIWPAEWLQTLQMKNRLQEEFQRVLKNS